MMRSHLDSVVGKNDTIIDAMRVIDQSGLRMCIVVDLDDFVGVITDGDIRRFILNNGNLNALADSIVNRNAIIILDNELNKAKKIFNTTPVTVIPVINQTNNVVGIISKEDISHANKMVQKPINIPVVIMAGGKGTRLYPYTKILPKPLIPIDDTPIVERIMNRFKKYTCNNFYISVNHKKEMIKAYFSEKTSEYNIEYIEEDVPLGTAGSLSLLKGKLTGTFFVTNCDVLVDANYYEIVDYHKKQGNLITIVTSLINHKVPYAVIKLNDEQRVATLIEKPDMHMLVNTGVYVLEASLLDKIPSSEVYHLTDLINQLLAEGLKVGTYPISEESWSDMGQLKEFEKMRQKFEKAEKKE